MSVQSSTLSWDLLKVPSSSQSEGPSSFYSEQSNYIRAATRHQCVMPSLSLCFNPHTAHRSVKPDITDRNTEYINVSQEDLMPQLRALALGTSSRLYAWEQNQQIFRLVNHNQDHSPKLLVDGLDDINTKR
jgi:hypothetical protein